MKDKNHKIGQRILYYVCVAKGAIPEKLLLKEPELSPRFFIGYWNRPERYQQKHHHKAGCRPAYLRRLPVVWHKTSGELPLNDVIPEEQKS